MINKDKNKETFLQIINENVSREGIKELLEYLENDTDFFSAPASSKFHLNEDGGLCQHSLNVYNELYNLCQLYYESVSQETIAIVGLFHDLCKVNMYQKSFRNVQKNGVWTKEPTYVVEDSFPVGHGEKSVILLQKFIKLTDEEIYAIRWHMGGFDNATKGGDFGLNNVFSKKEGQLVTLVIVADLISSNLVEFK